MSKIEYDNFPKFLVSLGIILIALPFFTIHFFLQENAVLLVAEDEIFSLTEVARKTIILKQDLCFWITDNIIILSVSCIVGGIILLILGCKMWYALQKKLNDKQEVELQTARMQLQKMSPEENEEKINREVMEMERPSAKDVEQNDANLTVTEIKARQEAIRKENSLIYHQISKRYMEIEVNVIKEIKCHLHDTHDTQENMKIGNLQYDAISISKTNDLDYIFEIKYLFSINSWNTDMWHSIPYRMKTQVDTYTQETGRKASPVLLIVTLDNQVTALKQMVNQRLVSEEIIVKVLSEKEIGIPQQ